MAKAHIYLSDFSIIFPSVLWDYSALFVLIL
uniref:Uncharacterized protein n=1 Tax=Anguilla anguilla TaxID=7936 RepID=A0A0E9W3D5_ANGAN